MNLETAGSIAAKDGKERKDSQEEGVKAPEEWRVRI